MCGPVRSVHTTVMSNYEAATGLPGLSQSIEALVASASRGVVTVGAYRSASGVVLPGNYIAVANHSVRRAEKIPVRTRDGDKGEASLAGRDEGIDVAILKTDNLNLSPLEPSDPSTWKPGGLAAVVGMTADVGASASLGILGAIGEGRNTWRGGRLDKFVRLDVNLYPSQTGAAVVDAAGGLIGMATPALSRHSAMAIPASTLHQLAERASKDGRLCQGYIGAGVQSVAIQSAVRERLNLNATAGLLLIHVEESSPAERAGLLLGDILVEAGGEWLAQPEDLQRVLRKTSVGAELSVTVLHGGELASRVAVVGERAKGR